MDAIHRSPATAPRHGFAPPAARVLLATALLATLAALPAAAALERVRVGVVTLEAPPGYRGPLAALATRTRDILPRIEADLGVRAERAFRVLLIPPGAVRDTELARIDAGPPEWASGYTIPELRVCAIRMAQAGRYPYGSLESVLAHEATHMLIHDAGVELPLWFEEGVATWQGRRWDLRDAIVYSSGLLTSDLPALAELDTAFHASSGEAQMAYAASYAFVARAIRGHGPMLVRDLMRELRDRPFAEAWQRITGTPLARDEAAWRRASLIRYRWIPVLTASSTLWIGIMLLSVIAGLRTRARARMLRERWIEEEARGEPGEPGEAPWEEPGGGEPGASGEGPRPPPGEPSGGAQGGAPGLPGGARDDRP